MDAGRRGGGCVETDIFAFVVDAVILVSSIGGRNGRLCSVRVVRHVCRLFRCGLTREFHSVGTVRVRGVRRRSGRRVWCDGIRIVLDSIFSGRRSRGRSR